MMKEYKAYIFDFDGTLFDTEKSLVRVFQAAFRAVGLDCDEKESEISMHRSVQETLKVHGIVNEDEVKKFMDAITIAIDEKETLDQIESFKDTLFVVEKLKNEGKMIGIMTNNTYVHVKKVLKMYNLNRLIVVVIGNSKKRQPKPHPQMLFMAMDRLNIKDKDCVVYIGDSLQDVETAKNGGVDGILVDRKNVYHDFDGLKISSLMELLEF